MVQDSIRDAPYRLAKSFGPLQVRNSNPQFRKINQAEGQPPLELSGTCQPFEPASVAHVARVREVKTQPSKEDKIFSNRHLIISILR